MNSQLIGPVTAARPNDETTPREPPPPPTVLDFPSCAPKRQGNKQEQLDVVKLLGNLVRTGPKLTHLEAFNVILDNNVTLEDFIPAATLPPASWLADSAVAGSSNVSTTPPQEPILSNGRPAPSSKVNKHQTLANPFPLSVAMLPADYHIIDRLPTLPAIEFTTCLVVAIAFKHSHVSYQCDADPGIL